MPPETCRVDLQRNKTSLHIVTSVGYSIEYYDARSNKYQVQTGKVFSFPFHSLHSKVVDTSMETDQTRTVTLASHKCSQLQSKPPIHVNVKTSTRPHFIHSEQFQPTSIYTFAEYCRLRIRIITFEVSHKSVIFIQII